MNPKILATKLNIPLCRPGLVPRPHLIERVNEGLTRKLTLISAPAGFGKTTLVSMWTAQASMPVAWLSLEEQENDLTRFLAYIITAIQGVDPEIGKDAQAILQTPQLPSYETILTGVINDLEVSDQHIALVLDDYHLIHTRVVHEAVGFLLEHLPPQTHVVMITRADPPLPIPRLRGMRELTELRAADLRFTLAEASDFLEQVASLSLSGDDVAALQNHTEGWVAALQMAALSMQGREDIRSFIASFTGSHQYIADYLTEEVLSQQTKEIRSFLLQTSILDRMTSSLCDAVLHDLGDTRSSVWDQMKLPDSCFQSQTILEQLKDSNLFIMPLDDNRHWYRYHRLFRDLLLIKLQQLTPDLVPDLHRRASDWFERAGLLSDAIEHALSARDFEHASHLMAQVGEEMLMRSEVGTLNRWLERLPEETLNEHPHLYLFHTCTLMLTGATPEIVEARLRNIGEQGGAHSARAAAIRAYLALYQGDFSSAWELSRLAWEQIPEDDRFMRGILSLIFGFSLLAKGDLNAGTKYLSDIARTSRDVENVMVEIITLCHLARLRMRAGDLTAAHDLYQRAIEETTDEKGHHLPIVGEAFLGLAEVWFQWNDLEKAEECILKYIQLTEAWSPVVALEGFLALARVRQAQGRGVEVRPLVEKARKLALQFEITELDDLMVDVYDARLSLAQGDVQAAARWVEGRNVDLSSFDSEHWVEQEGTISEHLRKYALLILARIHIAQGEPQRALEILTPLLSVMKSLHRTDLVLETLILQAVAHQVSGNSKEALTVLKDALSLGEHGNYVRIFIDEGPVMAKLLYEAAKQGISPEYCGKLLGCLTHIDHDDQSQSPLESEMIEPLSSREIEVLTLIAEGLSNREIAERLVISLGTVKVHARNIYGKLGVSNRTHAAAKARSIGIL